MSKFKDTLCHLIQYYNALISLQYAVHNDDAISIRALSEIISIWKPSQKFASSLIKAYFEEGDKEKCLNLFACQHQVLFKSFSKVCGDAGKNPSGFTEDAYEPIIHMFINLLQNAVDDMTYVEVCGIFMEMVVKLDEAGNAFFSQVVNSISENSLTHVIGCYLRYLMNSGASEGRIKETMAKFSTMGV